MKMLLGLCLLTLAVYKISALECYVCTTGCDDPFNSNGVSKVQCTGSCLKTKKDGSVTRACMPGKKDECETKDGAEGCACTTDLCNGATLEHVSIFGLITTVACVVLNFFNTFSNLF